MTAVRQNWFVSRMLTAQIQRVLAEVAGRKLVLVTKKPAVGRIGRLVPSPPRKSSVQMTEMVHLNLAVAAMKVHKPALATRAPAPGANGPNVLFRTYVLVREKHKASNNLVPRPDLKALRAVRNPEPKHVTQPMANGHMMAWSGGVVPVRVNVRPDKWRARMMGVAEPDIHIPARVIRTAHGVNMVRVNVRARMEYLNL